MSQQINLFNPVFMNQRKYFSLVAMLQGLALIVLGSGLFYGYAKYQIKTLSEQSDDSSKHYAIEQARVQRYTEEFSPDKSNQLLQSELKSVEAKLSVQNELVETFKNGKVGNATGHSGYLRAFANQAVNGLWLRNIEIFGDTQDMTITGSVLSPELLATYVSKLNQESAMRGKSFASLQMQRAGNDGRSVEFTLRSVEAKGAATK